MENAFTIAAYVVAGILFILSLGGLSGQESAKRAVWYGIVGMAIAVVATLVGPGSGLGIVSIILIAMGAAVGYQLATKVEMTQTPELVAIMHSLVGLAAVFVGFNADIMINYIGNVYDAQGLVMGVVGDDGVTAIGLPKEAYDGLSTFGQLIAKKSSVEIGILRVELVLGIWIGAVTFTGSVIAYAKLAGGDSKLPLEIDTSAKQLPGGHMLNAAAAGLSIIFAIMYLSGAGSWTLILLTLLALFIGYHLIMGIGGADMPVVVSMLNSYSGWAAAAIGFSLGNDLLIVVGALVGSSGAILSYIMCKAMNRSFVSVILGGTGEQMAVEGEQVAIDADGVATALNEADSIVIIPGYGMAVAQAQQGVAELTKRLRAKGKEVRFAIHPVAGPSARPHERASGRSQGALRYRSGNGRDQRRLPGYGCCHCHRLERHREPRRTGRPKQPHRRYAGSGMLESQAGLRIQARAGHRLFGHRKPAVL